MDFSVFLVVFFLGFFIFFTWTYSLLPVKLIFIFSSGLTLYCQSNSFSSFHLDLLSIASQTHSHFFIWTYSLLPIIFIFRLGLPLTVSSFRFSSGLTSNGQYFLFSYLGLPLTASSFCFSSELTSNGQYFLFSYLGLPLTVSSLHFHIWAYL